MNYKSVLGGTALLFIIDTYFYSTGLSWTPLHYESLAPLLLLGLGPEKRQGHSIAAIVAITLILGLIAVLYFSFNLNFHLAKESWIFTALMTSFILIFILQLSKNIIDNKKIPKIFLLALTSLVIADKGFSRDMLSSAYTPHFLGIDNKTTTTKSTNLIFSQLHENLSTGNGGILIVFESLGVAKNQLVLSKLISEYPEFDFSTRLHEGGSTLPAEIRYLCGVNGQLKDLSSCIPTKISSRAIHGNTLLYFNRNVLYKEIGFKKILGRHELPELEICDYSYKAICDNSLLKKTLQEVNETRCEEFHYILTIDSHFPYSKYKDHVNDLYTDLRKWLNEMKLILQAYPNCRVFIAGDHPPPLSPTFDEKHILTITSRHPPSEKPPLKH